MCTAGEWGPSPDWRSAHVQDERQAQSPPALPCPAPWPCPSNSRRRLDCVAVVGKNTGEASITVSLLSLSLLPPFSSFFLSSLLFSPYFLFLFFLLLLPTILSSLSNPFFPSFLFLSVCGFTNRLLLYRRSALWDFLINEPTANGLSAVVSAQPVRGCFHTTSFFT